MGVLLQRGTLVLPKVFGPPLVIEKDKDQFYKFHQASGNKIEDCFIIKNIVQDVIHKELLNKEAGSSGVMKDAFPSHREGQVSIVNTIKVVAPISNQPLDFFGLINVHCQAIHESSSLGTSTPRFYFELLETQWPSSPSSPPRPTYKVNTLQFRIKQEKFEHGDILDVGWCACQPITFTDDDLPVEGMHTSPLHLEVFTLGFNINKVLTDEGFLINIYPLRTAQEISIKRG